MRIEIWYDETSDSTSPTWCVSVCDEDGEIACVGTAETREEAVANGERRAAARGLPLCERDLDGVLTELV